MQLAIRTHNFFEFVNVSLSSLLVVTIAQDTKRPRGSQSRYAMF
ncbi:hypothetical protein BFV96_0522 [Alteromonas macleodii]|uniref:Uncharacterized protein n=1 Tax=Alteromonas macleodii TaxID=28108 RepID=A0AB36FYX0_ALTMA|nr:hypothetical protein BFV95_0520 [Alteromonas macleodii]OES37197.1 hypothetical protein BFV93_0521 [Alteromonas macleodii]OES41802.1 hypothetical protein BFV96_0522 [Alteromonas macleodii]